MNKTVINLLKIFLGLVFIFSGISKLFPIEPFELQLVNLGIVNWELVPYLSRAIIIFEIFLGVSLLQKGYIKKFFLPSAIILLTAFSVHLIYALTAEGLGENCGCFGQIIPMNNLDALIKNIVLIAIAVFVYIKIEKQKKLSLAVPAAVLAVIVALVFIIFPVKAYNVQDKTEVEEYVPLTDTYSEHTTLSSPDDSITSNDEKEKIKEYEVSDSGKVKDDKPVENKDENKSEIKVYPPKKSEFHKFTEFSGETVNLDKGLKIVALFSIDCEHCMDTANKIGKLKDEINLPPMYVLFLGFEDELPNFWKTAETTFPYKIIEPQTFFPLIGDFPPRVVLLNNGNIIDDWNYEAFSKMKLKEAVSQF